MNAVLMVLKVSRVVLYIAEWLMSVIVWGATADKLDFSGYCYFGKQTSCGAVIFFGVIATLVVTAVIANHILGYFSSKNALGRAHEILAFVCLTILWAVVALVTAVGSPKYNTNSTGNVVLAFSWINVVTHAMSAGVAFAESRVEPGDDDD